MDALKSVIKSYNTAAGYGFLVLERDGKNVFLGWNQMPRLRRGLKLAFTVEVMNGRRQAVDVRYYNADHPVRKDEMAGILRVFFHKDSRDSKGVCGYGFIAPDDGSNNVFVHGLEFMWCEGVEVNNETGETYLGTEVVFSLKRGDKGWVAIGVSLPEFGEPEYMEDKVAEPDSSSESDDEDGEDGVAETGSDEESE